MTELQRQTINPESVSAPLGNYSHVARVKAGELLYIAGQVGVDKEGNLVGTDAASQTRQVFENIEKILASQGATFSNVIEFTVYVVGRESIQPYMETRAKIIGEQFPNKDFPPSTLLVISGLAREEFRIEIKTIAALP